MYRMPDREVEGVTVKVEMITAERAKEILEQDNTANRKINDTNVDKIASDLENGRYRFNGASLVFGKSGRLLDGQHRLTVQVQTEADLYYIVVRRVDDDAFDTIDATKSRSVADILGMMGTTKGATISSVVRHIVSYKNNRTATGGSNSMSRKEITDWVLVNPYVIDITHKALDASGSLTPSQLASVLFIANETRQYDEEVTQFLNAIKTGENLKSGDPVLTLREWSVRQRMGGSRPDPSAMFAAISKAWTCYMNSERLPAMKYATSSADAVIYGYTRPKKTPSVKKPAKNNFVPQQLNV